MLLQMLLTLMTFGTKAQDIYETEFPPPTLDNDIILPDVTYKDLNNGCILGITNKGSMIYTGPNCKQFPANEDLETHHLQIRTTKISVLKQNDFRLLLDDLQTLDIEFNLDLIRIEPGCFKNMSQLINMSISFNKNLKHLDRNLFEGLINLKELHMNKNGFIQVFDITSTLSVHYVPTLRKLTIDENVFRNILKDDFAPMIHTKLQELQMILCQIEFIHPESLNPLKRLEKLKLGQNQFNVTTVENLINEIIKNDINLQYLDLYDNGFRKRPPMNLMKLISRTNISYLNLGRNVFDNLNQDSFPYMPNIVFLDLSYCLLLAIEPETFDKFPKLEVLILAGNKLPSLNSGLAIKQLKLLDVSSNSGNPISRSYFRINEGVFLGMDRLLGLQISNNLLSDIYSTTFQGLKNLRYLGLKNATVFTVEEGSFEHLNELIYLNLDNNQFTVNLKPSAFKGLSALKTLLLNGCSIDNLNGIPSLFTYLQNLTYLGLSANELYTLSPSIFKPLINMQILDLSDNKLTEWNEFLFTNLSVTALDLSQNKFKILTRTMLEDFKRLDFLNLQGNPFTCDCSLYPATKWLRESNFTFKYMTFDDLDARCVNSDTWGQYSVFSFMKYLAIKPDECENGNELNQTLFISILSVACTLITTLSILAYIYRLHIRHWMLLLRMTYRRLRNKKRDPKTSSDYKYDAFVSYSNEDHEFVSVLVQMLEDNEPFLKLCVYERDFQIGCAISESVLQSVVASRKTILIVSDAFAKSQWCRWEAKLAEYHHWFFQNGDVTNRQGAMLMILLGTVSESNLTPTLKYLLRTRIYLEWNPDPEKQATFWKKLRKKLSHTNALESCITINET